MAGIRLQSSAFSDHALIPRRYTRDGENVSPPLTWSLAPAETTELALLCEDPDAPAGTFLHCLVTGIDADCEGVDTGDLPSVGVPHVNGFGDRGWDGPQPPAGDPAHRYFFHLYALPERVELPDRASAADAHRAFDRRAVASGTLVGLHHR